MQIIDCVNVNYTPSTLGYKVEEKLHLGVSENTTGLGNLDV
jgi:hypothetical protein